MKPKLERSREREREKQKSNDFQTSSFIIQQHGSTIRRACLCLFKFYRPYFIANGKQEENSVAIVLIGLVRYNYVFNAK